MVEPFYLKIGTANRISVCVKNKEKQQQQQHQDED